MIKTFRHKGLKELFLNGKAKNLPQERIKKLRALLAVINSAHSIKDLHIPAGRLHKLKGPPYAGYWSIDVSGNYRIIFEFDDGEVTNVDYLDTH